MALSRRSLSLTGFFALSIAVTVAACADREDPLLPKGPEGPEVPVVPEKPLTYITCSADLQANAVTCAESVPDAGGARAERYGFGGANGQYVRVFRTDLGNAFNAADSTFQFDLALENLIPQALGTENGINPDPHGVRLFVITGPTVTVGAGSASISEPAAVGVLNNPGQHYAKWDEIIEAGDTSSAPKHWKFQLQGNVSNFTWSYAVSANMRWPNLVIADIALDSIFSGETVDLNAVYTNNYGEEINPGPPLSWSSDDTGVATVDPVTGVVTGVAFGTAHIVVTAPGGSARPDTVKIVVDDLPNPLDQTYAGLGNVTLDVDAAHGLLVGATDDGGSVTAVAATIPTTKGGQAVVSSDGSFVYTPPAGVTNESDGFTFEVKDAADRKADAVATINLGRRFWFVDGDAASGTGTFALPFPTLRQAADAAAAGDSIFVRSGTTDEGGGAVLRNGQVVIGQNPSVAIERDLEVQPGYVKTLAFLPTGATPTLGNSTSGATITLAQNNVLRRLSVTSTGGRTAIAGTGFGTATVSETDVSAAGPALNLSTGTLAASFGQLSSSGSGTTGLSLASVNGTLTATSGSITNPAGTAFNVSGGDVAVTYPGNISTNASRSVSITGRSTGTIVLSGAITDVGSGILVQNNTGGTVTFSGSSQTLSTAANNAVTLDSNTGATINFTGGALAITTTSGSGFVATGGGTVNVTGSENDVATGAGAALNLNGVTVGASGMALRSVSSSSATPVALTSVSGTINAAGGTITAGAGTAFAVSGGSVNVGWAGNVSQTNTGNRLLSVSNTHTGTLTFTGTLTGTNSTGLLFDAANGTYNVNGTATLNNTVALGDAGIDVQGGSTGTFSFGSGVAITNPVGIGLNVTASAPASLAYAGTISTGAASSNPVSITSLTGGSVTVSGGITSTGQGILVQNNSTGNPTITFSGGKSLSTGANTAVNLSTNTGATIDFTGGALNITTTTGTGFNATGGGTVNVTSTGSDNDVATGTGTALNLNNVTVGGVNLRTVNATAAPSAVVLTSVTGGNLTAASGTVTGAAGTPFSVAGGNVNVTWNGNISQATATQRLLNVSAGHTGTVTFQTGTLSATSGTGLLFNNADGTYSLNGTVTLNGGDAGIDVQGGSGGTFSFGSGVTITNPTSTSATTGIGLNVTASAPTVTYAGTISTGVASLNPVSITSLTGGSVTVSGGITSTGRGILVQNNTSGTPTITLSGGKTLNTTSFTAVDLDNNDAATITVGPAAMNISNNAGAGFRAVNGGTVNVTGTTNDVTTTTGTAVEVNGTTIGASGMRFRSVSANGAANGIFLSGTGSSGGVFRVDGTGAVGSGGSILNTVGADGATAGNGVYLNDVRNVVLTSMIINDHPNFGISGQTVNGFTLDNSRLAGTHGNNIGFDEAVISITGLSGQGVFSNDSISGGIEDNVRILNHGVVSPATDSILFNNVRMGHVNSTSGNTALLVRVADGSTNRVRVRNSTFHGARGGSMFHLNVVNTATARLALASNTFNNTQTQISGAGGVLVTASGTAASVPTLTYDITGNTFRGSRTVALNINKDVGQAVINGNVSGNTIGNAATANSGSVDGSGIQLRHQGGGTHRATVTNNQIFQYNNYGIILEAGDAVAGGGHGRMDITATSNTISNPGTLAFPFNGVHANIGTVTGDEHILCLVLTGNSVDNSGSAQDIRLRQRMESTIILPGYTSSASDNTLVNNFVKANNGNAAALVVSASNSVGVAAPNGPGNGFINGSCNAPTL